MQKQFFKRIDNTNLKCEKVIILHFIKVVVLLLRNTLYVRTKQKHVVFCVSITTNKSKDA